MNKVALSLAALSTFCFVQTASAAEQDFLLKNKTGYDIKEVYLSKPSSKSWGNDVLGSGVLVNGNAKEIHFKPTTEACEWELKVVFSDDEPAEWSAFDLCSIHKITLYYENNQASAESE